jgi:riboflavin biosynthesis pyrimidine reductase
VADAGAHDGLSPVAMEFAGIWQGADKIIYSRSLRSLSFPNARLEREFDPEEVRKLKARLSSDAMIGGPTLAAQAIRAGLVDEFSFMVCPAVLGGGIRVLPANVSMKLDLLDERRFGNGWVCLRYRTRA